MSDVHDSRLLLGKQTPVTDTYTPSLLYPIPRSEGRLKLATDVAMQWFGCDLWHAYELSWLNINGTPEVRVGRLQVPAASPNIVESKSLKLYLNSLNSTRFDSEAEFRATLTADISAVVGSAVELSLYPVDDPALSGSTLQGDCIDKYEPVVAHDEPSRETLKVLADIVQESLYSHLLRSLCPVTGQPDWASVLIRYEGRALDRAALLSYLLSYRRHHEFHEQCVERIFTDIAQVAEPESLAVQAFYTRRGGLDINPFRNSVPGGEPLPRMDRQ